MAGNVVYVQGSYVDVHDNEVVNLSIDKAGSVSIGEGQQGASSAVPAVLAESELWQRLKMPVWWMSTVSPWCRAPRRR